MKAQDTSKYFLNSLEGFEADLDENQIPGNTVLRQQHHFTSQAATVWTGVGFHPGNRISKYSTDPVLHGNKVECTREQGWMKS